MTVQTLKTEIEKINKGCGKQVIDKVSCGDKLGTFVTLWLCPTCRAKKQGLIQGAKMVIEEIKKISKEYFDREYYHDFPKEPFETLKQLNNWLEKE
jgi:hypothetical protein